MAEARRKSGALHVQAPMVVVRTENDRIVHLYRGDVLPDGIAEESVEHLKSLGFLTEDHVSPIA